METQSDKNLTEKELFVKMVVDAWETQNSRVDKLLAELSDKQLGKRAKSSPCRSRSLAEPVPKYKDS